jgi:hypothetical protein
VAATHLADTSALVQLYQPQIALRYGGLVMAGLVATTAAVDLDLVARFPPDERPDVLAERRFFRRVPCDDAVLDRALEVLTLVGDPPPTPLQLAVAASAERAGLVLIHDDDAFERIAAVTGQPLERTTASGGDR